MKKLLVLIALTIGTVAFSPLSQAHGDSGHPGHGWGWGHHHHHHEYYAPPPQVIYYPAPQVQYYQQPPVTYYQQRPAQYDQRTHQGLAGGVVGSVFGYELGNGDPLATGLGAAAGSFLGNGRW
ncbi:MAG: hypothetical protein ACXWF8_09855 [Methylobacter sp.]